MKVVFDGRFGDSSYADDNAAAPGRMEAAMGGVDPRRWPVVAPSPATPPQLARVHDPSYIGLVAKNAKLYELACLAAGGAVLAARIARNGEPAFACVRPPGHHASRNGAWGYCVFNNLVVALAELRAEGLIGKAFVIDIDQHTGDGTRGLLAGWAGTQTFNPFADDARGYRRAVEERLASVADVDIVGVSAGFDAYRLDVGRKLGTADFRTIASLIRDTALRVCGGRRFAVLEGGYYLPDLGANLRSFCEGFE